MAIGILTLTTLFWNPRKLIAALIEGVPNLLRMFVTAMAG